MRKYTPQAMKIASQSFVPTQLKLKNTTKPYTKEFQTVALEREFECAVGTTLNSVRLGKEGKVPFSLHPKGDGVRQVIGCPYL